MSDFLRLLAPRHADALRPVAPLRALAAPLAANADARESMGEPEVAGIAPPMPDPAKRRTAEAPMVHPHAGVLPRDAGGRTDAMGPTSPVPSPSASPGMDAASAPASGARPPDSPASPPSDSAGIDDPRIPGLVPAAHSDRHGPILEPHLAYEQARHGALPPVPSPRSGHVPERAAAPLSPATVALLAAASPTAAPPPAIHISIDRIDVRAQAQPAKPPSSRPRVAPEPQSLHDYLRRKSPP